MEEGLEWVICRHFFAERHRIERQVDAMRLCVGLSIDPNARRRQSFSKAISISGGQDQRRLVQSCVAVMKAVAYTASMEEELKVSKGDGLYTVAI